MRWRHCLILQSECSTFTTTGLRNSKSTSLIYRTPATSIENNDTWLTNQYPTHCLESVHSLKPSSINLLLAAKSDEFELYISQDPTLAVSQPVNLFQWFFERRETFPTLYQMALDTLSIPAMSAECERIFSRAKKLLKPARNGLQEGIIEATECLKHWWDKGIIQQ
jgi:hypothetical protein